MTRNRIVAVALAALAVIGIGVSASSTSSTQAAWTDEVYVTATATAGSWHAAGENSCTWWSDSGQEIEGCTIQKFVLKTSWGAPGQQRVQIDLVTSAPTALPEGVNSFYVSFEVDLTSAEGAPSTDDFNWDGAVLEQLTSANPSYGWECTRLPILSGVGSGAWQREFSITVAESGASMPRICG